VIRNYLFAGNVAKVNSPVNPAGGGNVNNLIGADVGPNFGGLAAGENIFVGPRIGYIPPGGRDNVGEGNNAVLCDQFYSIWEDILTTQGGISEGLILCERILDMCIELRIFLFFIKIVKLIVSLIC